MFAVYVCVVIYGFLVLIDYSVYPTIFEYDRTRGQWVRKTRHFWQLSYRETILCYHKDVENVRLKFRQLHPRVGGWCYCVVLELKNGQEVVLFPDGIKFRWYADRLMSKINHFLQGYENKLVLQNSEPVWFIRIFLIMFVMIFMITIVYPIYRWGW